MLPINRILIALASTIMIAAYFLPIWSIELEAPQYPEGLEMFINISSMSGDIEIINGLNHYIGMDLIEPESIPELTFMPFILGFLILFGLLTAIINKKSLLVIWVVLLIIAGIVGIVDFYIWEYNYGHNLDPTAPIKIPGMTYQPPLIGSKDLLNFRAHSYPDLGGIIIGIGGLIALFVLSYEKFFNLSAARKLTTVLPLFLLIGCSDNPVPINYGSDVCDHCIMRISDNKYGAQLVTPKGKNFNFDAIECMVNYYLQNNGEYKKYITDITNPGVLIPAEGSFYLISLKLKSPMGEFLNGFANLNTAEEYKTKFGGEIFNWNELLEKFEREKNTQQ